MCGVASRGATASAVFACASSLRSPTCGTTTVRPQSATSARTRLNVLPVATTRTRAATCRLRSRVSARRRFAWGDRRPRTRRPTRRGLRGSPLLARSGRVFPARWGCRGRALPLACAKAGFVRAAGQNRSHSSTAWAFGRIGLRARAHAPRREEPLDGRVAFGHGAYPSRFPRRRRLGACDHIALHGRCANGLVDEGPPLRPRTACSSFSRCAL